MLSYSFSVYSVLKDWPINGGRDLRTDSSTNDLLLTGLVHFFTVLSSVWFLLEFFFVQFSLATLVGFLSVLL